jgi:hypothetical protein
MVVEYLALALVKQLLKLPHPQHHHCFHRHRAQLIDCGVVAAMAAHIMSIVPYQLSSHPIVDE